MGKNKNTPISSDKTSRTPEMIPSMFNWITPDIQEIRAKHLANVTKKKV